MVLHVFVSFQSSHCSCSELSPPSCCFCHFLYNCTKEGRLAPHLEVYKRDPWRPRLYTSKCGASCPSLTQLLYENGDNSGSVVKALNVKNNGTIKSQQKHRTKIDSVCTGFSCITSDIYFCLHTHYIRYLSCMMLLVWRRSEFDSRSYDTWASGFEDRQDCVYWCCNMGSFPWRSWLLVLPREEWRHYGYDNIIHVG